MSGSKTDEYGESVTRSPVRSLKINAATNWAVVATQVGAGLFITPFVIARLGETQYGIWALISSLVSYYAILNLGVESAVARYLSLYTGRDDRRGQRQIASASLLILTFTAVVALIGTMLAAPQMSILFKIGSDQREAFGFVIQTLGASAAISFPAVVFNSILIARERFLEVNIVRIAAIAIRTCVLVLLLNDSPDLRRVAIPSLGASFFSIIAFMVLWRRLAPDVGVSVRSIKFTRIQELVSFGGISFVISVADIFRLNFDSVVIGRYLGMSEVGVYAIASSIIYYMMRIVVSACSVLNPRFSSMRGAGDDTALRALFLRSLSVSSVLAAGFGMAIVIVGPAFIDMWVGPNFSGAAPILIVLAVSYTFALAQNPAIGLMFAMNKHKYYALATVLEAFANLVISIALMPRLGILGVALGTCIPMLVVKILFQPVYVSRIVGVKVVEYFVQFLTPLALAFVTWVLAPTALGPSMPDAPRALANVASLALASISCLFFVLLSVIFVPEVRRQALAFAGRNK